MSMYNPYQNYIPQPNYNTFIQPNNAFNQNTQTLVRVNGIDGAKAYQNIGVNSTVALFDANEDLFYLKQTDGAGFPTIRTFRFEELVGTQMSQPSEYVTRKDMEDYVKQFIQSASAETTATVQPGTDKHSQANVIE